jgi:hypothetical protein
MAIRFLPNDPLAGRDAPPLRRKAPLPNRPAGRAGFTLHDPEPEGLYDPGSAAFLFWQCREAALLTLATWERHAPILREWQGRRSRLHLYQNAVAQLGEPPEPNAFYDRTGFLFFEATAGGRTSWAGASTDVVAHEVGHGLLDAMRPDLWDTPFLEVNAFHEAFGDCIALLTALDDARTRASVLRVGLGRRNFLETFGEDLAAAIRRERPTHNASVPRRALNTLQWQLPSNLPVQGGPGALIAESHSFARVFTGCFWDLVRNLLGQATSSAALRRAALRAGRLLVRGAAAAPETARFFRAVGSGMALADEEETGGAHRDAIRNAYSAHGIALGSHAMLAPVAALDGPGPTAAAAGAPALHATTRRDLRGRLGTSSKARMVLKRRAIGGERVVEALHLREVPLGNVSERLRGVVALAPEGVLVGRSGRHAAVLGGLPEAGTTTDEVEAYVASLVAHDRIDYGTGRESRGAAPRASRRGMSWHSHVIRPSAGRRVLARVRFSCP